MAQGAWSFYTAKELKPEGWLKRQLKLQAEGLHGNLDRVWRDVKDSAWIGGTAESWERVPYWLDGFIPLAYLLEDEDMIARAKRYIDAILDRQKEDGWLCPCPDQERWQYDTWAVQLVSKVLAVYYQCSGDERALKALYRMLKNYYALLSSGKIHLFGWGKARWFETFIGIGLLYKRCPEDWLVELDRLLREQGQDYNQVVSRWKRPLNQWSLETHIVNLAMMLRAEAASCEVLGLPYTGKADRWDNLLKKYNGTPVELFTGDECLSGLSPIQGTELCAVVEQMYSYEQLYACTGDSKWAELLETVAFNGLPAAISDDMWAHQYDQMSNQISCDFEAGKFYAIVGQSGSGKSTLLSMLAGLGTPDEGEVLFKGKSVKEIGSECHRRENVSVIYQAFNLFPTLNLLENIMYPMQIQKGPKVEAKSRAEGLLGLVGLGDVNPRKLPAMLSGGQQQRVAIARALASSAPVILADEPTGNLDSENSENIIALLKGLTKNEGRCVIIVTHDLGIAGQADVVYRMRDGRLEGTEVA